MASPRTAEGSVPVNSPPDWHRPHWKMGLPGILRFVVLFVWEILSNLPGMLALRAQYRKRRRDPARDPVIVCVGDNLDEVNGIALSSRILIRHLRARGKQAFLFGVAFHSRQPRTEEADGSVILSPGRFSMEQAGYAASEVVLPRLSHFIRFARLHPLDIIEFQTPAPTTMLCLITARIAGIKTLSHYRTDILTYSRLLVRNRLGVWIINTWTRLLTRMAGPVIVPSLAYRDKVAQMGVPEGRIFKLPRGVDLENYHPAKAAGGAWRDAGLPEDGVKLLYVGRISKEKNLELLGKIFPALLAKQPDLSLVLVGDGPYREELQGRLGKSRRVHFTGMVQGEKLAGLFASADIFVFPSLTDTFGNSVIEALASGVPCIVSDQGGPPEIIVDGECGLVFDSRRPGDLERKILELAGDPGRLQAFKAKARERALHFSYDSSALAFWDFYCRYYRNGL